MSIFNKKTEETLPPVENTPEIPVVKAPEVTNSYSDMMG